MPPVWIVLIMLPLLGGAERFNCRGRILGAYYADAKSGCKAFHVCVRVAGGGIRDFRFFCPPGTLFHQEAQTCTDWGDDDPLACPADLYDGQFDLYKIGSGYDTKKLSAQGNRDEESEFGLQRAETGDSRSQNNGAASDLRTAHSSDFFSGQRDRGRDEQSPPRPAPSASPTSHRQSFRRIPSSRPPPSPTTYSTTPSTQQSELPQYESHSKRKLVRKRPIYVSSTQPPTTFAQSSSSQAEQQFNQQRSFPQQNQQQINQKQQQINHQQQKINKQQHQLNQQQQHFNQQQQQKQQFSTPQQPFSQKQQPLPTQKQSYPKPPQQAYSELPEQNFNQRVPQKTTTTIATPPPPTNLPAQYKDEYVEVSRVAPIKKNRYYINTPSTPSGFAQTSSPYFNKKEGLAELYNYNSQSTPALSNQNENKPFKVRNSFSVQDVSKEDFARINTNYQPNNGRGTPSTADYNSVSTRTSASTTPAYKNFNSVSYEPEKNNFVQYNNKQNYFNSPSTTPVTTTYYTTVRVNPPKRLNTVAYNTNNALNIVQQSNFADNDEDDGQYRPPQGEDDGQYRPELYERELLTGAHSLNIAASGNRLPEDQKQSSKSQINSKPTSQSPVPRPFRPAPTPTLLPAQTTKSAEIFYTTTPRAPTVSTEKIFDQYKSYTTTSRPEPSVPEVSFNFPVVSNVPARPTTTVASRTPEPRAPSVAPIRPTTRAPIPPSVAPPRPTTRAPHPAKPVNNKEDSSYDYAYYDSDPGFSEYDQIEEFGRTKKRT